MKLRLGNTSMQYEESYALLAKYGYDCADFQMAYTEDSIYTCEKDEFVSRLKTIKSYADNYGITIHQMHGPWSWPIREEKPGGAEERFEKMSKSITAAPYLGCKNWVIHPLMPYGIFDIHLMKDKDTFDFNVDFFSRLLKIAKENDVTICVENMPYKNYSLSTPAKLVQLVETINDENFRLCLDTGHIACFNNLPVGDAARTMGKYLRVLHVHDNHTEDSHEIPYLGKIDWEEFYQGLVDIKFDGVFSLETQVPHWKVNEKAYDLMARALVMIAKQILHEPVE